jgi:hypothetical protein
MDDKLFNFTSRDIVGNCVPLILGEDVFNVNLFVMLLFNILFVLFGCNRFCSINFVNNLFLVVLRFVTKLNLLLVE